MKSASFAVALAACALLAACSGGSQSFTSIPAGGTTQAAAHTASPDLARTGIAPQFLSAMRSLRVAPVHAKPAHGGPADLYVDNLLPNTIDVLANKTWAPAGTISGLNGPDGNFADRNGRLYVANYTGDYVTEYAPGATMPAFTYTAGMIDPVDVTVDGHGKVFEADFDSALGNGFVNEYPAGVNSVVHSCAPGGDVDGVAVDGFGNVFATVEYSNPTAAAIVEYTGGLKGCHATKLGVPITFAGGIAIDAQGNLLVCDQLAATVDVIAPPYTSVTRTIGSGFGDPFHVTINKKNNQAYVADYLNNEVFVLTYPAGAITSILGSAQGLTNVIAAVDGQNYVP